MSAYVPMKGPLPGAQILTISLKTDMTRSRVTKLLETVHT